MADIQEKFKEAWAQALVGSTAAEAEAERVITRLADAAGFSPDEVRRHARELGERLGAQRREVEKTIDEAVRRAAVRFKLPTRGDIEDLKKRLDQISERVDALTREKGEK